MKAPPSLAFSISWIARLSRTRFDARARTIGLTRAQWSMIASISLRQGATQSDLASALEINSVTAGRIIDKLEAAGWIERRSDPADRRANRVYLKDAAMPVLNAMTCLAADEETIATAGMDEAEVKLLTALLGRMICNLTGAPTHAAQDDGRDFAPLPQMQEHRA